MKLKEVIHPGIKLPPWYMGYSYREVLERRCVFYVIPLNYLVRWAHSIKYAWNYIRCRKIASEIDHLRDAEWVMVRRDWYEKAQSRLSETS